MIERIKLFASSTLVFAAFLSMTAVAQDSSAFFVGITFGNGTLSLSDIYVSSGNAPDKVEGGTEYTYNVISSNGNVLYSSGFDGPGKLIYHSSNQGPETSDVYVIVPYFSSAATIDIFNVSGTKLLSIDTSGFQQSVEVEGRETTPPNDFYYVLIGIAAVVCFAVYFLFLHNRKEDAFGSLMKKWS